MKKLETLLKAVANERRLKILKFLKEHKEASVANIAEKINTSFTATSKHLIILSRAGIIEREQEGYQGIYRLAKNQEPVIKLLISQF